MANLTPFPFGLRGTIYRSPMPFHASYDPSGEILGEAVTAGVAVVVPLASAEECRQKSARDLFALYAEKNLTVRNFAIEDFGVPDANALARLDSIIEATIAEAEAGRSVLVHCSAGMGRTGLFVSCLTARNLRIDGDDAIAWVRRVLPGAVETSEQQEYVRRYAIRARSQST